MVDQFETNKIRVVPIPYDTTEPELYFQMINGLCIADNIKGDTRIHPTFLRTIAWFIERSKKEYFPIWAECFGYQLLIFIIGHVRKLKEYDITGTIPIYPTGAPSRLLDSFSASYRHYLEQPSTFHNHLHGISPSDVIKNKRLHHFFHILATSFDKKGNECVALMEAKDYPIYGIGFHPFNMKHNIPFYQFIRSELLKNKHHCSAPYLHQTRNYHYHISNGTRHSFYFF
jgi:anthranilate/para-aminobenzoate synthase component II